ncbi:hypothetical protein Tco_1221309 [Tanacetum coccineum]
MILCSVNEIVRSTSSDNMQGEEENAAGYRLLCMTGNGDDYEAAGRKSALHMEALPIFKMMDGQAEYALKL